MLIVTGGAGFIGSNLVHELNAHGLCDILVVDHLANAAKIKNLEGARFVDYMDKAEFRRAIREKSLGVRNVEAVFHQGACSNTLEDDGVYMMDNNFTCSKELLDFAIHYNAPMVYASTAAVYGLSGPGHFTPTMENERPLNIYGFSKLAFDHYIRRRIERKNLPIPVVGLRYFNVYGPREQHKGRMASVMNHFAREMKTTGKIRLFEASGGYPNGGQMRDFVYVRDLLKINLFFASLGPYGASRPQAPVQAVVNAGSGVARSFNDVAHALMAVHGESKIEYIPFPKDLEGRYQHFTESDNSMLRKLGYAETMTTLETGVREMFAAMEV